MLTRNRFITNSSSTAFVAWGIIFPKDYIDPGFIDDLFDLSIETDKVIFTDIEDDERFILYAWGSRTDVEYYFYGLLPKSDQLPKTKEWKQDILKVCHEFDIELDPSLEFGWFFTNYQN